MFKAQITTSKLVNGRTHQVWTFPSWVLLDDAVEKIRRYPEVSTVRRISTDKVLVILKKE